MTFKELLVAYKINRETFKEIRRASMTMAAQNRLWCLLILFLMPFGIVFALLRGAYSFTEESLIMILGLFHPKPALWLIGNEEDRDNAKNTDLDSDDNRSQDQEDPGDQGDNKP